MYLATKVMSSCVLSNFIFNTIFCTVFLRTNVWNDHSKWPRTVTAILSSSFAAVVFLKQSCMNLCFTEEHSASMSM